MMAAFACRGDFTTAGGVESAALIKKSNDGL
jgi:hypothetical protein